MTDPQRLSITPGGDGLLLCAEIDGDITVYSLTIAEARQLIRDLSRHADAVATRRLLHELAAADEPEADAEDTKPFSPIEGE